MSNLWCLASKRRMGMQGSGWGWLGWSKGLNKLMYASTANQDPLILQVRCSCCPLWKPTRTTIAATARRVP